MIGELNQRAAILGRVMTPDGGGGFGQTWETLASVWASLEALSGAETFGPDANESRVRYRIRMRRYNIAAAGQRVKIGARKFHVHAVEDEGPAAPLIALLCEELP